MRLSPSLLALGMLLALVPAASRGAEDSLARASSLDLDLLRLSSDFSQMAVADRALIPGGFTDHDEFIPSTISAYESPEPDGRKLIILVTHRHAGAIKTDADAKRACQGMINWVRFNLGVKHDGEGLIAQASKYDSSTMYEWVHARGAVDAKLARALDAATIILASVRQVTNYDEHGAIASCRAPLVSAGAKARLDIR